MKTAAIVTIKDAKKMTPAGRKRIAAWLRKQAAYLVKHGEEFSGTFTCRYWYE